MIPRPPTPRPITRPRAARPPHLPAGPARLMAALRPYVHQLRPGSAAVLASVAWRDLHDVRGAGPLEALVCSRLALPENRRHLVGPFDPRDRVGPPPGSPPADGPPARHAPPRPLTSPEESS
jgi:hypothetical protein